jgi:hypothetical protein
MFLLLLLRCSERHFCSCGGPVYYSRGSVIVSSRNNLYKYYYNKGLLRQCSLATVTVQRSRALADQILRARSWWRSS